MKVIDTHLHIWNLEQFSLPWLNGLGEPLEKSYSEEDYLNELKGNADYQVEKAVYIEVDVAQDQKQQEAEFIIGKCRSQESIIMAAVISGNVSDPDFPAYLDMYKGSPIRGIRQVLHVDEAPRGMCLKTEFIRGIRELGERQLVFEACMRTPELADLCELAKQCPNTTIIMDHMGNIDAALIGKDAPTKEEKQVADEWIRNMEELAKCPNVICKVSGLNPAGEWDADLFRSAVNTVLDLFGEDRVIYASNYPVCQAFTGMLPWLKALDEITRERGERFRNKLFYENALRIYGRGE